MGSVKGKFKTSLTAHIIEAVALQQQLHLCSSTEQYAPFVIVTIHLPKKEIKTKPKQKVKQNVIFRRSLLYFALQALYKHNNNIS